MKGNSKWERQGRKVDVCTMNYGWRGTAKRQSYIVLGQNPERRMSAESNVHSKVGWRRGGILHKSIVNVLSVCNENVEGEKWGPTSNK